MKILTDTGLMVLWNKIKQLVLGNRPYNPSEFSGNGYKVLEKNIQTVDGIKKNILTAVMLSEANTIYEIRYDFDLNGADINIPSNCVLKFTGGKLSNGNIVGNNTTIENESDLIFENVRLIWGTYTNSYILADWFDSIQSALNSYPNVYLCKKDYEVTDTLRFNAYNTLIGNGAKIIYKKESSHNNYIIPSDNNVSDSVYEETYVIQLGYRCVISDCTIKVNAVNNNGILIDPHYIEYTSANLIFGSDNIILMRGVSLPMISNVRIENKYYITGGISKSNGSAISIIDYNNINNSAGLWGHLIDNVSIIGNWYYGITIDNGKRFDKSNNTYWITTSVISNIVISTAKVGIYIGQSNQYSNKVVPPSGIVFNDVVFQYSLEIMSDRYAILNNCSGITFNRCSVVGWDDNNTIFNNRPFLINPNKTDYTFIYNSFTSLHKTSKIFDLSENPTKATGLSLTVSDDLHSINTPQLTDYLPIQYNDDNSIKELSDKDILSKLLIVPNGRYIVTPLLSLYLKVDLAPNGLYILDVMATSKNRIFILYYAYNDGTESNSYPFAQIMRIPNNATAFNKYYWHKFQNQIVKRPLNKFRKGSNELFISEKQNLTYISESSKTIFRGYAFTKIEEEIHFAGATVDRPSMSTLSTQIGFQYYDTDLNCPMLWNGSEWVGIIPKGTSMQRPSLGNTNDGFEYYDTDLDMPIYWNAKTQRWLGTDGFTASYHKGDNNSRPTLTINDKGFTYWDISLNKLIIWNGSAWVNMDGTVLT